MRAVFFVSAAFGVLLLPAVARAETGVAPTDACISAEAVVPLTLPANVPGIPIYTAASMTTASLLAADGTVVPSALVNDPSDEFASVLVPKAPLAVGATYTVRWTDDCVGIRTKSFVTTAVAPLPAVAGSVSAGPAVNRPTGTTGAGEPASTVERSIAFTPVAALEPFLAISSATLVVNGIIERRAFNAGGYFAGTRVGTAFRKCPYPPEPITEQIRLRVQLPAGPSVMTEAITVELACPDPSAEPTPTTGTDDVRSGCATHGSSHDAHALLFLVAAAALRRARRGGAPRTSRPPIDEAR